MFGKVPKDIDIWVPAFEAGQAPLFGRGQMEADNLLDRAAEVLVRLGRVVDEEWFAETQGAYGAVQLNHNGGQFLCVKAKEVEGQHPVDVIFHPSFTGGNWTGFIDNIFDLEICKVGIKPNGDFVEPRGKAHLAYHTGVQEYGDHHLMRYAVTGFIEHFKRIREKYPQQKIRLTFSPRHIPNFYATFANAGVLDIDEARQVLPAEAQGIAWDEVRLDDRANAVQHLAEDIARLNDRELVQRLAERALRGHRVAIPRE